MPLRRAPRPFLPALALLAACTVGPVDEGVDAGTTDAGPDAGSDMPAPPQTASTPIGDCTNGRIVTVDHGIDGDTIQLDVWANGSRERVRMVGVDTPESYPVDDKECYGDEAKAHTHAVLDGQRICLTYDPAVTAQSNNVDMYGRTLGYVWLGQNWSRFYNAELVWDGYANDYPYTRGAVYESYLRSLETAAFQGNRGMWSACR